MADVDGNKTGGRKAGTPNKSSKAVKQFLDRVFTRAFSEKRSTVVSKDGGRTFFAEERSLEDRLVDDIITGRIDPGEFRLLLAYWAGRPVQPFEHNHRGKVTLEKLIAGTATQDDEDEDA